MLQTDIFARGGGAQVFTPRPYQLEAEAAALEALDSRKNPVLVLPTGSGKSLVIARLATQLRKRILVLQPTKEILEQNYDKLWAFGHRNMAVCSASAGSKGRGQVTFGTIGTVKPRIEWFRDVDLVVVDEAHLVNAQAGQYSELIRDLGVPAIGLTATPYRMAASQAGEVVEAKFLHRTRPRIFDRIGYIAQNADLHAQGWLAPIEYEIEPSYNPYEIALKSTGLNFQERALADYNRAHGLIRQIADTVVNNLGAVRHFLIFVASLDESREVEQLLARTGIRVAHVDGETPKTRREAILEGFKAGEIDVVTNVGVLTTGYDFPALDGIVLGRPTMSLPLHYQMIGRGVRTSPGKDCCRVFDLCGNIKRFGRPDRYRIVDKDDRGLHRLADDDRYYTGVNFVTGRDLERDRQRRQTRVAALESGTETRVTFGKHKGKLVSQLDLGYVKWCAENFDGGRWKQVFEAEIARRRALMPR